MPDSIVINTKDLNNETIQAIRERFGVNVDLTIQAVSPAQRAVLEDPAGWSLIDLLDWQQNTVEEIVAPLVAGLQKGPISDIYRFNDWLSEKLYLLDTPAHAEAYLEGDDYLSVDDFLYARCAIVAEGQEIFEAILANPAEMSAEVTFEPLLYVAYQAYELKTGEEMVYIPLYNYETYGNRSAWGKKG